MSALALQRLPSIMAAPNSESNPTRSGALPASVGASAHALARTGSVPVLWLGLLVVSMFVGLPFRPLTEPDEGRNAEVAREMAASGDYVLPRLNGLPYVDKPLVYYAAVAGSFKLLGLSEFAARLPSAVATLLTALLVGAFARHLFGPQAGVPAGGALLATPLAWTFGQIVILDALFTLLVVAAIVAFYLAIEASTAGQRQARLGWSLAAWTAVALGILTKGPVGLLLPLLVAAPYAVYRRAAPAVFDPRGILLGTLLITPWVWAMDTRLPGYLHYVAVVETWQRVATSGLNRSKPFWFFIPVLLIGTFPSSAMALAGAWRALLSRRQGLEPRWVFLGIWILAPLAFFSLSRSKLPHYVLPLVPAFALAASGLWIKRHPGAVPGLRAASWCWIAIGVLLVCAMGLPAIRALEAPWRSEAHYIALFAAAGAIAAGVLGLQRSLAPAALWVVTLPLLAMYLSGMPLFASLAAILSTRELAAEIRTAIPDGGQVIGVHAFPLTLPFYLRQLIVLASDDGAELTSNYVIATYPYWVRMKSTLRPDWFWRSALQQCREPTVFVTEVPNRAVRQALAEAGLPLLAGNRWFVVYGPCRPAAKSAE
jgi:4-amino-4-deoxy-L-arabinose transferase-like glycosyltransferase